MSTSNTPIIRSEGLTEALSDIFIFCLGGASAPAGQLIPQVNVKVSLPAPVTSRLLRGNVSEALLLLDEPNSGLSLPGAVPGFGPAEPFTFCKTPLAGCPAWAQQTTDIGGNIYEVAVNAPTATPTPGSAAPNVYQGVVSGNQLTFFNVPVLAPGNNGVRLLRITNVRLDASQIAGISPAGSVPVQAAISTDLPLANPTPLVAFAQSSLTSSVITPPQLAACNSQTLEQAAILTYNEPFASAFKTRVDPSVPGQPSGQSSGLVQNVPGTIYFSESDFTLGVPESSPAGLANFGTRLKAVFRNVPPGVRLFVSLTNVTVDPNTGLATGQAPNSSLSFAELVHSETGPFSVPAAGASTPDTNIQLVEITPSDDSGSATAVWEVVSSQPSALDTLQFGVFVSYDGARSGPGSAAVNLSYAPTTTATEDEDSVVIPRFHATPQQPVPLLRLCGNSDSERN